MEKSVNSPPSNKKVMPLTEQEEKRLEELNKFIAKYEKILDAAIKERRLLIYKVEKL